MILLLKLCWKYQSVLLLWEVFITATTKKRTIHFFDLTAIQFDPVNPKTELPADLEALWKNLKRLQPIKGVSDSSFHAFWGQEMVVAIDHNNADVVLGRSAKLRQDALPGLLSDGEFKRIRIGDNDFLHETAHFAFFKRSKIIAIEYNSHAPGYRYFEKYLNDMAHALVMPVDRISLEMKLEKNTIGRLLASGAVTAVEVTAHADDIAGLPSTNKLAQALRGVVPGDTTERYKATVAWSRARPARNRPRGLEDDFKNQAVALHETSAALLDALKVTVEPASGGKPRTIDLLKDRFAVSLEVLLTAERSIDSEDTYGKIITYYNDYAIGETDET